MIIGITEIDFSGDLAFEYRGIIEESNPCNQYYAIQSKVGKQERSINAQELVQSLYSTEDKTMLLSDVRLAMSFLEQTGGSPDKRLSEFMQAFSIDKSRRLIDKYPELRLSHILDLFEKVEDSLHNELLQRTDPRYQGPLEADHLRLLQAAMAR